MKTKAWIGLIFAITVLLLGWNSIYIVTEIQRIVLLRVGQLIDTNISPGLKFKYPFFDKVKTFDARIQTLDSAPEFFITKDKKRVNVDSYVQWRIKDVSTYYRKTGGDDQSTRNLLAPRVNQGLRNKFGKRELNEVIFSEREEIMEELTRELNIITQKDLGVEVIDIRIKKIELPQSTYQSVYDRMRAERHKEANRYRADGRKEAERIRSEADLTARTTIAESYNEAQKIRGDGDALATSTYAKAYNRDPDFFSFYRSLSAYKETFNSKGDILVLEPNSEFFKYLNKPNK